MIAMFVMLFIVVSMTASAAGIPMLQGHVNDPTGLWEYGKTGRHFIGYIPALGEKASDNPWKLYQWKGIFTFADGQKQPIDNYDVFAVKEKPGDPEFSDKNGFGLTYKSKKAVGDLFDAVWSGHLTNTSQNQRQYFRDTFIVRGTDYDENHDYFYKIEDWFYFLRTSGIVSRMGIKFDHTEKKGSEGYAYFDVSAWPTLKVTQGDALNISFTASGYSQRNIRLIAAPKGAFPDLSKVVSLTDGKLINTSEEQYTGSVKINAKDISRVLGTDVDIIIDDGYGRTAIESVKLPDAQPMDYVPTKLTLTEGGQLWVKFRYDGEDIITSDYVNERGMPMTATVKVGGAVTAEFSLPSMNDKLPATLKNGQEFNYMLGKIEISDSS
ncbi:hypothetical protein ABD76_21035 [Paenibacillus dendritiformis]|uniref:hypothetical protein n=1 Tax=Paenibacillus dendritiformis TaxID=130049 RepID=UPI0018CED9A5|nr:hypothetical protein [Paenibacillus dendritiformis]MBG9794829.1 hypothetical protein [Paenibacillus dendritiformis]